MNATITYVSGSFIDERAIEDIGRTVNMFPFSKEVEGYSLGLQTIYQPKREFSIFLTIRSKASDYHGPL